MLIIDFAQKTVKKKGKKHVYFIEDVKLVSASSSSSSSADDSPATSATLTLQQHDRDKPQDGHILLHISFFYP